MTRRLSIEAVNALVALHHADNSGAPRLKIGTYMRDKLTGLGLISVGPDRLPYLTYKGAKIAEEYAGS